MGKLDLFENDIWKIGKERFKNKKNPNKKEIINKNKKHFIDISNNLCNKTSIVYYGEKDNGFPITEIDSDKADLITFANAPSQLYGNLLNMLKYRNEMGIKVDNKK